MELEVLKWQFVFRTLLSQQNNKIIQAYCIFLLFVALMLLILMLYLLGDSCALLIPDSSLGI